MALLSRVCRQLILDIYWTTAPPSPGGARGERLKSVLAPAVVRRTLDGIRAGLHNESGLGLVVATPAGQQHEVGAMLAAAGYRAALEEVDALWLPDAPALRSALDLVLVLTAGGSGRRAGAR